MAPESMGIGFWRVPLSSLRTLDNVLDIFSDLLGNILNSRMQHSMSNNNVPLNHLNYIAFHFSSFILMNP